MSGRGLLAGFFTGAGQGVSKVGLLGYENEIEQEKERVRALREDNLARLQHSFRMGEQESAQKAAMDLSKTKFDQDQQLQRQQNEFAGNLETVRQNAAVNQEATRQQGDIALEQERHKGRMAELAASGKPDKPNTAILKDAEGNERLMQHVGGTNWVDISQTNQPAPTAEEIRAQVESEASQRNPAGPDFLRAGAVRKAYDGLTEQQWIDREVQRRMNGTQSTAQTAQQATQQAGDRQQNQSVSDIRKLYMGDAGNAGQTSSAKVGSTAKPEPAFPTQTRAEAEKAKADAGRQEMETLKAQINRDRELHASASASPTTQLQNQQSYKASADALNKVRRDLKDNYAPSRTDIAAAWPFIEQSGEFTPQQKQYFLSILQGK